MYSYKRVRQKQKRKEGRKMGRGREGNEERETERGKKWLIQKCWKSYVTMTNI